MTLCEYLPPRKLDLSWQTIAIDVMSFNIDVKKGRGCGRLQSLNSLFCTALFYLVCVMWIPDDFTHEWFKHSRETHFFNGFLVSILGKATQLEECFIENEAATSYAAHKLINAWKRSAVYQLPTRLAIHHTIWDFDDMRAFKSKRRPNAQAQY